MLASQLPLPVPVPVARGVLDLDYPYPWSIYRWLEGTPAADAGDPRRSRLRRRRGRLPPALQAVDPTGGPAPGPHNSFRGGPLSTYAAETERALTTLGDAVPTLRCRAVWAEAHAETWTGDPVWVHGDVAVGNRWSGPAGWPR